MLKKIWEMTAVRAVLVLIFTIILIYGSSTFYLWNGGMFWFVILTYGVYLLFFIVPYIGVFTVSKKVNPRKTIVFLMLLVSLHTVLVAGYTDLYIYTDEGGVSKVAADPFLRFSSILSGVLLLVFYSLRLFEGRHVK
ncbi:hypothetical protein HB847_15795 [Listeria booriae]|uniref:Uncharacterized protein n=1 Tax=Listeria booriae TaxID=1552123 RepID=A0A841YA73_9LIST|nr:hypothetical protein [Listeria booriae]MBC1373815.1 hypothetical protein [Listeria booriae]